MHGHVGAERQLHSNERESALPEHVCQIDADRLREDRLFALLIEVLDAHEKRVDVRRALVVLAREREQVKVGRHARRLERAQAGQRAQRLRRIEREQRKRTIVDAVRKLAVQPSRVADAIEEHRDDPVHHQTFISKLRLILGKDKE